MTAYALSKPRERNIQTRIYNVERDYGAVSDSFGQDGTITSAGTTLTVATARFTASDVGKYLYILRGGPSSMQPFHSQIASVAGDGLSCTFTGGHTTGRAIAGVARYGYGFEQTTQIQAAIDDCSAAGGGTVSCPGVSYPVSGLVLKNRVTLRGSGKRSTMLHLLPAVNVPVVKVEWNGSTIAANYCGIRHMMLNGNRSRQTATPTLPTSGNIFAGQDGAHGFQMLVQGGASYASEEDGSDCHNFAEHVHIFNCKGNGYYGYGHAEVRLSHVQASYCDGIPFVVGYDHNLVDCIADHGGYQGFWTASTSVRMSTCKSWFNGQISATNGNGYHFENQSNGAVTLVGCEAQDNKGSGYYLNGCKRITLTGCMADTNNNSTGTGGQTSTTAHAGVTLNNATNNTIGEFVSVDRFATKSQNAAILMLGTSTGNQFEGTHSANNYTRENPVHTSSTSVSKNNIRIDNQGGHQASVFTSNAYAPRIYDGTLIELVMGASGAHSISAPDTLCKGHEGVMVTFFISKPTGSTATLTWNAVWKTIDGGPVPDPAANKTISISFFNYDGTNWRQMYPALTTA